MSVMARANDEACTLVNLLSGDHSQAGSKAIDTGFFSSRTGIVGTGYAALDYLLKRSTIT